MKYKYKIIYAGDEWTETFLNIQKELKIDESETVQGLTSVVGTTDKISIVAYLFQTDNRIKQVSIWK